LLIFADIAAKLPLPQCNDLASPQQSFGTAPVFPLRNNAASPCSKTAAARSATTSPLRNKASEPLLFSRCATMPPVPAAKLPLPAVQRPRPFATKLRNRPCFPVAQQCRRSLQQNCRCRSAMISPLTPPYDSMHCDRSIKGPGDFSEKRKPSWYRRFHRRR
jgi:hypothetical protein